MKRKVVDFVISWLETIAVIGFLLFPVMGLFIGGSGSGFVGAIVGVLLATIFGIVLFGGLFLLIQNNQTLRDIRALLQAKNS